MSKIIGIYKITSPTNKVYIGQSVDIENRKSKYKNLLCSSQPKIYRSLKKYSWEQHEFEIIEECLINELDNREYFWKKYFNSVEKGLNCHYKDTNGGYKSLDTRKKMSESHKGKHNLSKEHISKIIQTNKNNKYSLGRKDNEQVKNKRNNSISKTRANKKWECGRKPGWEMTEEHKMKLRIPKSEKAKNNMRKPRSEQGRQNMKVPKPNLQKNVSQYDLKGNFIKRWDSITEIYLYFNKPINSSAITCCLKGRQKTAYGYIWKNN